MSQSFPAIALKYVLILATLTFAFGQFLACGSQFYQVSVENDVSPPSSQPNQPITDPDDPGFGLHAPDGWSELPIEIKFEDSLGQDKVDAITRAMKTWEHATGRIGEIFSFAGFHHGVTAEAFTSLGASLKDDVNGHYFDSTWQNAQKPMHVIATTIWGPGPEGYNAISTGDIRYNNQTYIFGDALFEGASHERQIVDLESLALHEVGHFLGLDHVSRSHDPFSIMNPVVMVGEGFANRQLSRGDIERIQRIYGCTGLACDVDAYLDDLAWNHRQKIADTTSP